MIGLLQDPRLREYDILAVQEPWRNQDNSEGYNPASSPFHLVEKTSKSTRTALYINKRIPLSAWDEIYKSEDLIVIRIWTKERQAVYIYNVYNPPISHSDQQLPEVLAKLNELLVAHQHQGDSVILGDFNLHHPLWNHISYPRHHYIADDLLEIVSGVEARLATPRGIVTRDCQRGPNRERTTIDLLFSTLETIEGCRIAKELDHGSDHQPVQSIFLLRDKVATPPPVPKRVWKELDTETFLTALDTKVPNLDKRILYTKEDIDRYVQDLQEGLREAVVASVPLRKGSVYDKGFWTTECLVAVKTTRYFRRSYTRQPTLENWNLFVKQRNSKGKVLAKAKRDFYRQRVHEITGKQPWSLYKWAKRRAQGQSTPISLPTLSKDGIKAISVEEKSTLLRQEAFPAPREATLIDIQTARYPTPLDTPDEISNDEIKHASLRTKSDKAAGPDQIPNRVIHILARHRDSLLKTLFQACWDLAYHPIAFHKAVTVFLRKHGKGDYTDPAAYRPIALLSTLGKVLESIVSTRLRDLAETHTLLPDSQYGARPGRSTETALFQIIEKIRAVQSVNLIPSLLALDVQKAFDNVSHERLLHDLQKRRVPTKIIEWIKSFLSNRFTSIRIADFTSEEEEITTGIPQGSPISPILYLFYNADLLDECLDIALSTDPTGFVDDIHILTFSQTIERNCRNLEKVYRKCTKWAQTHGSKFNSEKSELIHFTGKKRLKSKESSINLEGAIIKPSKTIRILGAFLNRGLTAEAHLSTIQKRASSLLLALKSLTQSTWGAPLEGARELYLRAIRPALSYGSIAWFPVLKDPKTLRKTLQSIQGRFLRTITGAYKATATEALEIETYTEPLDLYIERNANLGFTRQSNQGQGKRIKELRQRLEYRTRGRRGRKRQFPPLYHERALQNQKQKGIYLPKRSNVDLDTSKEWKRYQKSLEAYYAIKWRKRWASGTKGRAIARYRPYPMRQALEIYKGRAKPMTSILILLRTEKIGLRAFLHGMKVPAVDNPQCDCGQREETVQHFLLECAQWDRQRQTLGPYRRKTLKEILGSREGSKRATEFVLQTGRLEQFQAVAQQGSDKQP
jgi:hypothetical protein